ncbi:MAG: hypothetical protein IJH56_04160 [Firmicutes bacterium]|nr:hypothetical protein [Bacillota bacterium]
MPIPPRRLQQRQQRQQQTRPRPPQTEPPRESAAPSFPAVPRSLPELKQLLQLYGPFLSAETRALIGELVTRLEGGGDAGSLLELAGRLQQELRRQQGE